VSIWIKTQVRAQEFRMPVQWVNRPNLDFRGFSGKIAAGTIKPGDEVRILPLAKPAMWIASLHTMVIWTVRRQVSQSH
jgi:sulfate adenylyltransferase subunit 1 (EFTu-like GTPase family)